MPENKRIMLGDWHSDDWWMHVYEDNLSPEEGRLWDLHLATCETCQQEWAVMHRLDYLMQQSPSIPSLSTDFTSATVQRIMRKQRLRRILAFLVGAIVIAGISLSIFVAIGNAFQTLDQYLQVIFSARYVLFSSLVQIVLGLIEGWRMVLPFFIGLSIFVFLALMPNSALVTFAVVWYARRQQMQLKAI